MSRFKLIWAVGVLLLAIAVPTQAQIYPGTWDTMNSDLQAGTWLETFGPTGPGHPGCELSAMATDGMQWSLGNIFIVMPAVPHDNGDGTTTYTTDYYNTGDPGMSYLMLAAAPTLWGDAVTFTNLAITVQALVENSTGQYLGGTFVGGAETASGLVISMSGTLSETATNPPIGHEGTVDYMQVTITPASLPLDIKPGSCPNAFNTKSRGKLPVALLGTADFDVATVDVTTLLLARVDGVGGTVAPLCGPHGPKVEIEDVGTPFVGGPCECHMMGGDGIYDLTMKFDTAQTVMVLQLDGLQAGDTLPLVLTGNLLDGTPFEAVDCIGLVGGSVGPKKSVGASLLN